MSALAILASPAALALTIAADPPAVILHLFSTPCPQPETPRDKALAEKFCSSPSEVVCAEDEAQPAAPSAGMSETLQSQSLAEFYASRFKLDLKAAIQHRLPASSDSLRKKMTAIVDGIRIVTGRPGPGHPSDDPAVTARLKERWPLICGEDGMRQNAFAPPFLSGTILVCPGLLAKTPLHDPANVFAVADDLHHHLAGLLTHEMGHEMEERYQSDPEFSNEAIYGTYLSCVGKLDHAPGEIPPLSELETQSEIIADYWSTQAMAEFLESQGLTPAKAVGVLRASWKPMCGAPAKNGHPSGRFRIDEILGKDPSIRRIMGCSVSAAKPGCSL